MLEEGASASDEASWAGWFVHASLFCYTIPMLVKQYYVYIMTTKMNNSLYVGVTNDLNRRVFEHKNHLVEGFTNRYHIEKLVHYEIADNAKSAISREKQIKKWLRRKKVELIQANNPDWRDLYEAL